MSDLTGLRKFFADGPTNVHTGTSNFPCLVCQGEQLEGPGKIVTILEPNGLAGVVSKVHLCDDHANVHPRIIRKRLEDYYK